MKSRLRLFGTTGSRQVLMLLLALSCGAARGQAPDQVRASYERGCAAFTAGDYATAARSLSELAPFDQAGEMGLHAQYLLARVHHLSGERPEAAAGYSAMVAAWEKTRKDAPAPDFVARGLFYWGVVLSEFGRADAA